MAGLFDAALTTNDLTLLCFSWWGSHKFRTNWIRDVAAEYLKKYHHQRHPTSSRQPPRFSDKRYLLKFRCRPAVHKEIRTDKLL
jgi:hypothetical protein